MIRRSKNEGTKVDKKARRRGERKGTKDQRKADKRKERKIRRGERKDKRGGSGRVSEAPMRTSPGRSQTRTLMDGPPLKIGGPESKQVTRDKTMSPADVVRNRGGRKR